jgi:NADPH2:quinone reductase
MRAIVIDRFGGPEVLVEREVDRPTPGPGQVLVRVLAVGTNPVDTKCRRDGTWAGIKPPAMLGWDVSGVVDALGPGVTDFAVGDEVYYLADILAGAGAYAEYHVAPATLVARRPRGLDPVQAAAVPLAGGTAWDAIVRRLAVRVGETVLIHGGAGGVGSFAVQMARASGARVLATAGPDNQQTLAALGADVAIDYRQRDPIEVALAETGGVGVDAVFDTAGVNLLPSVRATRMYGRMCTVLPLSGDFGFFYRRNLTIHGVFVRPDRTRLEEMGRLLERGLLRPLVDRVLPLAEARAAHERLESGHGRGKIVLQVA